MICIKYLIAFIGYGEAAYHISKGLHNEGINNIIAFDLKQQDKIAGEIIKSRSKEVGIELAPTLEQAYSSAKFIFSLTNAIVAYDVADSILPNLREGQVYVDMNSTSPNTMVKMDLIKRQEGVFFCDVSLMNSVPKSGHKTKMYVSGDGAKIFYDTFKVLNTNINLLDTPAGGASAIKMFKSVFSKGFPQLILECFLASERYGVLDEIVNAIKDTFKDRNIEEFANETLYTTLIHAKRRAAEVQEVCDTLEELGVDASISRATVYKLEKLAEIDYATIIGDNRHTDLRDIIKLIVNI
ncbi:MAG: DUF1932 domain-containing protein [Dethiosulfatibacter sp.]|nr:DUF1932 domain-containing protein [Dethiosulfatibacter sp.]